MNETEAEKIIDRIRSCLDWWAADITYKAPEQFRDTERRYVMGLLRELHDIVGGKA